MTSSATVPLSGSPDPRSSRAAAHVTAVVAWDLPALRTSHAETAGAWLAALDGLPAARPSTNAIEATAADALVALAAGDVSEGMARARRAARLANGSASGASGTLAHLVLARARRHVGRPHLCVRIVDDLRAASPPAWHPWLAWEAWLAGVVDPGDAPSRLAPAVNAERTPAAEAARALGRLLAAMRAGGDHDDAARGLLAATAPVPLFHAEAQHLVSLLRPSATATPEVDAWRRGLTWRPPAGLQALCGGPDAPGGGTWAYVVALPGAPGVRVPRAALRDATSAPEPEVGFERATDPAHVRTATALATLALAGPEGLELPEFFGAVYGFTYKARLHQQTVDGLVYRAKQELGARGELSRGERRVRLTLHAPLQIPDPRCAESTEDRLVRTLARQGPLGARELSEALGTPLRSVQAALHTLVDDDACQPLRHGRAVVYQLQDTTFALAPGDPDRRR